MSHTSRLRDTQTSHVRVTLDQEPGHETGEYVVVATREVHRLLLRIIPVTRWEIVFLERAQERATASAVFEHAVDIFL